MRKLSLMLVVIVAVVVTGCSGFSRRGHKAEKMKKEDLKSVVMPFYTKALTVNDETNVAELMNELLADDFKSINTTETKEKEVLTKQIQYFWKLVPNLKWEPQEFIQQGNKVVVRSIATGNPVGNFFGVECDGSKAFSIMTIDIHTVENGKVVEVYHIEEWGTAIKQLTAK